MEDQKISTWAQFRAWVSNVWAASFDSVKAVATGAGLAVGCGAVTSVAALATAVLVIWAPVRLAWITGKSLWSWGRGLFAKSESPSVAINLTDTIPSA
jgi:hypothetical protein